MEKEYNVIQLDGNTEEIVFTGSYEECEEQVSLIDYDSNQVYMYAIREVIND